MLQDTIAAISTALIPAAIGIVRMSGPDAVFIAEKIFQPLRPDVRLQAMENRRFYQGHIHETGGAVVDEVLLVLMRAPHSYTGDDVVEFHCHGSPLVLRHVLELCIANGARAAAAGEFTRRAYINGKLDLVQVEAVADLLEAGSGRAAAAAAAQLSGELSTRIAEAKERLLGFLAHVQAAIDYPEEVPEPAPAFWRQQTREVHGEFAALLAAARQGLRIRAGVDTVLVGRPNVGKSSLLNMLLAVDRAIVAEQPGTTRDVIEETLEIAGVAFRLSDTAGLRRQGQAVEMLGMERTRAKVAGADLIVAVFDRSQPLTADDRETLALIREKKAVVVLNKSDLPPCLTREDIGGLPVVEVSALQGAGRDELMAAMAALAEVAVGPEAGAPVLLTRPRQIGALRGAGAALQRALAGAEKGLTADCLALELEEAIRHLDELTGATSREEVIEEIFRRFCVGK